jgi:hypothetical protein
VIFLSRSPARRARSRLVFVSLSINLAKIIELPNVTGRAAETIVVLGGALLGSLLALMPHQSAPQLGWELFSVTAAAWIVPSLVQVKAVRTGTSRRGYLALRLFLHQMATGPGVIASLLFITGGNGMPWFAYGILWSFVAGLVNAWILLVEIVR